MDDVLLVAIGGIFVVTGVAAIFNLRGTADRLARFRPTPPRMREPVPAASRTTMRAWGVAALIIGLAMVLGGARG